MQERGRKIEEGLAPLLDAPLLNSHRECHPDPLPLGIYEGKGANILRGASAPTPHLIFDAAAVVSFYLFSCLTSILTV